MVQQDIGSRKRFRENASPSKKLFARLPNVSNKWAVIILERFPYNPIPVKNKAVIPKVTKYGIIRKSCLSI